MKRRPWSTRYKAGAAALLVVACQASPEVRSNSAASASPNPAKPARAPTPALGLAYVRVMAGGAEPNEAAPLIVALHGLGDRPENFVTLFSPFRARARIVAPHSRDTYDHGFAWFPPSDPSSDESAPALGKAADEVAAFIDKAATAWPILGKPLVVGFSQGGALSYAIAVRHPESIGGAFPIGGWLPPPLWPTNRPTSPLSIFAFHGNADDRVPLKRDRTGAKHLESLGFGMHFEEVDGVGHSIPPQISDRLFVELARETEKQRSAGPR